MLDGIQVCVITFCLGLAYGVGVSVASRSKGSLFFVRVTCSVRLLDMVRSLLMTEAVRVLMMGGGVFGTSFRSRSRLRVCLIMRSYGWI